MSFLIYLGIAAVQDFRKKQISVWLCLFFLGHFLTARVVQWMPDVDFHLSPASWWFLRFGYPETVWVLLAGCGIGMFLLGVSLATRGGIGLGDGCFFFVSGLYLGFWRNVFLLAASLFLGCIAGAVKLLLGKLQGRDARKDTLPFLVFALPAGIWMMLGGGL